MADAKVYCRYLGENSQRQGHLESPECSRPWAMSWRKKYKRRKKREGNQVQQPRCPEVQKAVTTMSDFYREGQPSPWAGEVQSRGLAVPARRAL